MTVGNDLINTGRREKEEFSIVGLLIEEREKSYQKEKDKYLLALRFVNHISSTLKDLPGTTDTVRCYPHMQIMYDGAHLIVSYSTDSEEDSNTVRGDIQRVLNIPAGREVGYGGHVSWVFNKEYDDPIFKVKELDANTQSLRFGVLRITINHGRLAPGCELVEEERTVKEYKIVCSEGQEEVLNEG